MDSQAPVDSAVQPAEQQAHVPSGEYQAPPLANGEQQAQVAPEPQQPVVPESEQPITREEFNRVMQELESAKGDSALLAQIKELSDHQRLQQQTVAEAQQVFDRISEAPDNETAIRMLTDYITGHDQQIIEPLQQQVNDYYSQVENYIWEANKPILADNYIQQYGLPPSMKEDLLALPDDQSMKLLAERGKRIYADAQHQWNQQAAGNQVNRMKQSGVLAVGGEGGSPEPMEIQPGTVKELLPVMRKFFGLPN